MGIRAGLYILENRSCPCHNSNPRSFSPWSSHCTSYAVPAPKVCDVQAKIFWSGCLEHDILQLCTDRCRRVSLLWDNIASVAILCSCHLNVFVLRVICECCSTVKWHSLRNREFPSSFLSWRFSGYNVYLWMIFMFQNGPKLGWGFWTFRLHTNLDWWKCGECASSHPRGQTCIVGSVCNIRGMSYVKRLCITKEGWNMKQIAAKFVHVHWDWKVGKGWNVTLS